jgi:ribose transport system substrate-binding protein
MSQTLFRGVALSALALVLTGCQQRHSPEEKYYLVASNIKLPYWKAAAAGLYRAGDQLKVKAEVAGPDTYDPPAQQKEFQRVAALKPAGILVSPADPSLLKADIDAALAQGIPVITMDSDAPGSKRLTFIGTNNFEAGVMGGRVAAEALKGKGSVVVYTISGQANLEERLRGYQSVFSQHPGIKIVETVNVRGDVRLAFDRTMEIVKTGKPAADGFVCMEAVACNGVAEVLDREGVKGKVVVAMDTDAETLEWVEKGLIAATIAQKPFTMAFYGLKALDDLHHHKPTPLTAEWDREPLALLPTFIDTGITLVNKSNLAGFRNPKEFKTIEEGQ